MEQPGDHERGRGPGYTRSAFLAVCGFLFVIGAAKLAASPSSPSGDAPATQTQAAAPPASATSKAPMRACQAPMVFAGMPGLTAIGPPA